MIDPYYVFAILIMFYFICDLVIFYKKENIKKIYKKICTVILFSITILSIFFAIIDYNLIKEDKMPVFMIQLTKPDPSGTPTYRWEYIGLGYKMTLYNDQGLITVSDDVINDSSDINFRSLFYLFGVNHNTINEVVNIIDTLEENGLPCDDVLEYFYEDKENIYYFSCVKKHGIIVKYENGVEESFDEAFPKNIDLEDLDKHNINYITEKK